MKAKKCRECGIGTISPQKGPGRFVRYKTMANLEIPSDFEIPTCDNCGAEWLNKNAASKLDETLETLFRANLKKRAQEAIKLLVEHVPKYKLESLLGLSHGYLSKLSSGDRDPSAELVSQLAMLAKDPSSRVLELEKFWEQK
jgi:hypothetical protein